VGVDMSGGQLLWCYAGAGCVGKLSILSRSDQEKTFLQVIWTAVRYRHVMVDKARQKKILEILLEEPEN
jgi:hypothetical protein